VNRSDLSLRAIWATVLFLFTFVCMQAPAQQFETTSAPIPTYRNPELLFLTPQPYSKLHVEVDAVEGAEPSAGIIQALEKFLNRYCDKPDGIEMARHKSIPRAEARGVPEEVLTWRYMDGLPAGSDKAATAYLYVLFFDSRLSGTATSDEGVEPYTTPRYPCAIFIDAAYWGSNFHRFVPRIVCHEAGHLLGLVKNTRHGDGAHCRNTSCLMFPTHSETRALASRAYREAFDLCPACRADIDLMKERSSDPKLSFNGPALVRTERFYRVIQLPNIIFWDYAPFKKSFDWRSISQAALNRWQSEGTQNSLRYLTWRNWTGRQDLAPFRSALQRALYDPDPRVVSLVEEITQRSIPAKSAY
jgi:hypothetical protein